MTLMTPLKTNMTIEKHPSEDASPIKDGGFPASHVNLREIIRFLTSLDFFLKKIGPAK